MPSTVLLREVTEADLPIFFEHQLDPAAKDNVASLRVLEKCGFTVVGYEKGFANARGEEIEEVILELRADGKEEAQ
jgi:L-amino acid N-acyltransferase YncA